MNQPPKPGIFANIFAGVVLLIILWVVVLGGALLIKAMLEALF